MNLDPHSIQLSSDQQALLHDLSEATGKPWPVVLDEALRAYGADEDKSHDNGAESFAMRAEKLRLLGCLSGGPADLSSNPAYLEGLGSRND